MNDWRFPACTGLAVGIGVPLARHAAPVLFPGLDNAWGVFAVNVAFAGCVGAIAALVVAGIYRLINRSTPSATEDPRNPSSEKAR